jgi:hypothetical protein
VQAVDETGCRAFGTGTRTVLEHGARPWLPLRCQYLVSRLPQCEMAAQAGIVVLLCRAP